MAKNLGGTKRDARYVPPAFRGDIRELSKSDLMEIVWDFAVSSVGDDQGEIAAYEEIRDRAIILNNSQGTGSCAAVRTMKNGVQLARKAGHHEAAHYNDDGTRREG